MKRDMVLSLFFNACGRGSSPLGGATPQIQTKTVQIAPSFDTQALFNLMLTHGAPHAHSIWCSVLDTHALFILMLTHGARSPGETSQTQDSQNSYL